LCFAYCEKLNAVYNSGAAALPIHTTGPPAVAGSNAAEVQEEQHPGRFVQKGQQHQQSRQKELLLCQLLQQDHLQRQAQHVLLCLRSS
jgi:hypothetical protein